MKQLLLSICCGLLICPSQMLSAQDKAASDCLPVRMEENEGADKQFPYDNFFIQRSYPDYKDILPGMENAKRIARQSMNNYSRSFNFNLQWQIEGPTDIGGRANVVAIDPTDSNIIYTGTANGGIYKSTDGGASWFSLVDTLSYFAVGDIKIDPANHNTIYVGLGDPNISGFPAIGNGILKSTDAGATWHNIGLSDTRVISKIEIHPLNHNIIYAGAMGLPYAKNNQRGLYKSSDAGQTWNQVLFVSDSAGIIDLLLDNTDTSIVYAVSWNRIRQNLRGLIAGPDAKIWKSTNGGTTWTQLTNGLPTGSFSRIAIAKSSQNHNTLYAEYDDSASLDIYGIYKSTNGGASWTALNVSQLTSQQVQGGFGWYFGNLTVNPYDDKELFVLGVELWSTNDSGNNWNEVGPPWWTYSLHADKHCLRFLNQNSMFLCTDGGLYKSLDQGSSWNAINEIPNTQFYHVAVSATHPGIYYGGAQDNGTTSGNISGLNNWPRNYGGDGFQQRFHPTNQQIWYTETQNGAIVYTDNDGASFFDATTGIDAAEVRNWDMPYILSYTDPNTLYTGTNRIYQSAGSYIPNWQPISPVLTDVTAGDSSFRNISTIDESPLNANIVYAGTSDGRVWRTTGQGNSWQNISSTLPNRYVTHIKASNIHSNVVFVSHSGYKDNDNIPHIHMSVDTGSTWSDISGDLPPFAVNHIELSHLNDSLIFAATDGGVYYTLNMGVNWQRLGVNMPLFTIYDITLDEPNKKLAAATFARSIWSVSVDSILASFSLSLVASANDTICAGGSVQLQASGAVSYAWTPSTNLSCSNCASPTASPTATTTYIVTGSNGASSASDTVVVFVNPQPAATITKSGDTLFATAGTSYQWYLNGSPISNATGNVYVAKTSGNYSVILSNVYGCSKNSNTLAVTILGLDNLILANAFNIYPNPFSDKLTVEKSTEGDWKMILRDISGREITTQNIFMAKTEVPLNELSSGIYFAEFNNGQTGFVKRIAKF